MAQKVWIRQSGAWVNVKDPDYLYIRTGQQWRMVTAAFVRNTQVWTSAGYIPQVTQPLNSRITSAVTSNTAVTLAWDVPAVSTGLTGYTATMQLCTSAGAPSGSPVTATTTGTSYTFTTTIDTKYQYWVQANGPSGPGPSSNIVQLQTGHPQVTGQTPVYGYNAGAKFLWALHSGSWGGGRAPGHWLSSGTNLANITGDANLSTDWRSESISSIGGQQTGNDVPGSHVRMQGVGIMLPDNLSRYGTQNWLIDSVYVYFNMGSSATNSLVSTNTFDTGQDTHLYFADENDVMIEGPAAPDNRTLTLFNNGNFNSTFTAGLVSDSRWKTKFNHNRWGSASTSVAQPGAGQYQTAIPCSVEVGPGKHPTFMYIGVGPNMAVEQLNNTNHLMFDLICGSISDIWVDIQPYQILRYDSYVQTPATNNVSW